MANLTFLLILTGLTGIHSITTVSKVSVKAGDSISIPCLCESKYRNHVKYLCQGYYWSSCSFAVTTNKPSSGKFSISDNKKRIFTVTINNLTAQDTDYWCVVEINGGSDVGQPFHLSVTTDTPNLYVDRQEVTAFKGGSITISCYHRISGQMKWCKLGSSCVTKSSGSIDGTRVTIDTSVSNVFTVTMSGLRTESSGWYWCVKGDLQMPVHVTVTEQPTTRIHSIITVNKVSVKAGDSISIPCLYDSEYMNHVKYLCQGYYWSSCSSAVTTNKPSSGQFSIFDDKNQRIFTVTINNLTAQDTDYWCVVEINRGSDVREYFHLSVTTGTPSLYVDRQEVTAFKGGNITIGCHHRISGQMKWCRLGRSCVTGSSGSIDGTRVTIDTSVFHVFTVTMSGLRTESSGWYWCVKGDAQMPVHVMVHEQFTTNTPTATRRLITLSPTAEHMTHTFTAQNGHPSASSFSTSLIIRLSLLVIFVMVTSFIWLMVTRHKHTRESSATTTAEEEVRYIRETSDETSNAESYADGILSISSVVTATARR